MKRWLYILYLTASMLLSMSRKLSIGVPFVYYIQYQMFLFPPPLHWKPCYSYLVSCNKTWLIKHPTFYKYLCLYLSTYCACDTATAYFSQYTGKFSLAVLRFWAKLRQSKVSISSNARQECACGHLFSGLRNSLLCLDHKVCAGTNPWNLLRGSIIRPTLKIVSWLFTVSQI